MSEPERARVIAEARTWIGTPWHHMAAIKGAGVDCAMLMARVYIAAGLVAEFDPRPYPMDWMLHRSDERFLGFLLARSHQVAIPQAGDAMILPVGRAFAHGGIVTKAAPLTLLHAFRPVGAVVEEAVASNGLLRPARALYASFWSEGP